MRDTIVEYRVEKNAPGEHTARLRLIYTDTGKLIRLDRYAFAEAGTPFQTNLFDPEEKRVFILIYQNQLCLEYVTDKTVIPGLTFLANTKFTRGSNDVVAGVPCTTWQTEAGQRAGTICVSKDGVILRSVQPDLVLEAISVAEHAPPPDAFVVPSDLQRVKASLPQRNTPAGTAPAGANRKTQ